MWETQRGTMDVSTVSPGNYFAWLEQARLFADMAAFNLDNATVSDGDGAAERVVASVITPNFFSVLGARPMLGAPFDEASVRESGGRLVILGHALWTRRYGADPDIVGKSVRVDGRSYQVAGVMAETYRQPERLLTWQRPESAAPAARGATERGPGGRYLRTVARLAPGATAVRAQQEMDDVVRRLTALHPEENEGHLALVRTLDDYLLGDARPTLLTLLAAGAAVFLLVCANVANLTLARGDERQREFALRAALGSGHPRLLRQLLLEGVALALTGAAVGTALVYLGGDLIQAVQARFFSGLVDVRVDVRVIAFTALAALLAGVLSGLPVARAAMRADVAHSLVGSDPLHPQRVLGSGGASGAGRTRSLLWSARSRSRPRSRRWRRCSRARSTKLVSVDTGFDAPRVITFTAAAPPDRGVGDGGRYFREYFREVHDGVAAVPGVERVGLTTDLPFTAENRWTEPVVAGRPLPPPENRPRAEFHTVLPEYFDVMGIPLLSGRLPERAWEAEYPVPVVINQEMSERFWPGGDALGRLFRRTTTPSRPASSAWWPARWTMGMPPHPIPSSTCRSARACSDRWCSSSASRVIPRRSRRGSAGPWPAWIRTSQRTASACWTTCSRKRSCARGRRR